MRRVRLIFPDTMSFFRFVVDHGIQDYESDSLGLVLTTKLTDKEIVEAELYYSARVLILA
jgi:hypothetical protein